MAGSLAFAQSTLTIASGSITATRTAHLVAAETGTTDDLANIGTGSVSDFAFLIIQNDSGDTITVKDAATGAGEIHMSDNADYALSGDFSLTLQRRGTDWYEISRSNQAALIGGLEFVSKAGLTTATTVVVTGLAAGFDYIFVLEAFAPTDDAELIFMRFSDDAGVSYEADAGDYSWDGQRLGVTQTNQADTEIQLSLDITLGNDADLFSTLEMTLINPNAGDERTTMLWHGHIEDSAATPIHTALTATAIFTQGNDAVNAVQFLWSGGSTFKAQGDITVWRRKRS